jgi:DNA-directed RNA polymerase specialized sigma24 family protein
MQVLWGRHHVRVFRFGLRLVRDKQVAENQRGRRISVWLCASVPENTVKTRLFYFYARRKLAELLKAAGVDRGWP